jgi:hypothetical protein
VTVAGFDAINFSGTDGTRNWGVPTTHGFGVQSAVGKLPATLTSVTYFPFATIVGDDTDSRTLQLFTQDGSYQDIEDPTVVAELALVSGVSVGAGEPLEIPIVDSTLTHLLYWVTTKVGGGLADPGGTLKVRWTF